MKVLAKLLVTSLLLLVSSVNAQEKIQERPDWQKYFDEFNARGTIVVADERVKTNPV